MVSAFFGKFSAIPGEIRDFISLDADTQHQPTGLAMQLTPHRPPVSDNTGVSFPKLECWNPMTKVATIAAEVNKKCILCRISQDVMEDKYGTSEEEPMQTVVQHRAAIQEAARKLIENNVFEEDGSVLIRASDI